jgi:hypothetical protein
VPFSAKNADNYCDYDSTTGVTTLKKDSLALCTVTGGADAGFGDSVQIDIYIWLEAATRTARSISAIPH